MNTVQRLKTTLNRVILPILLLAPIIAGAAKPIPDNRPPGALPTGSGLYQSTSLIGTISTVIRWGLGFLGIFIFSIFLFAGFEYATSGGDDTKAQAATKRMVNAVIGLIITFFAFVASNAVLGFILQQA